MAVAQVMKRIPRIKFPQRHPKPPGGAQPQSATPADKTQDRLLMSTEVPATPQNTAVGGKASLQPKRTPVSEREIESILLGGCF